MVRLFKHYPIENFKLFNQRLSERTLTDIKTYAKDYNIEYKDKQLVWTLEEVNFIKENYSTKGADYCAKVVKRTPQAVKYKAYSLGLKLDSNYLITPKGEIRYRDFSNILDLSNPKIVYLLGLLWADGYVGKSIVISNVSEDLNEIIGKLNISDLLPGVSINYKLPQRSGWKPQTSITFGNKEVISFLVQNNYTKSREKEPIILDSIPENLKHLWFRGYLDGDGCVYYLANKPAQCYLSFSGNSISTYFFLQRLGLQFNISSKIVCRQSKIGSKFSKVIFEGKKRAIPILDYIYQDWDDFNLGLDRKYHKYIQLRNCLYSKV